MGPRTTEAPRRDSVSFQVLNVNIFRPKISWTSRMVFSFQFSIEESSSLVKESSFSIEQSSFMILINRREFIYKNDYKTGASSRTARIPCSRSTPVSLVIEESFDFPLENVGFPLKNVDFIMKIDTGRQFYVVKHESSQVILQWKNPDSLFKNPDFRLKNVDFIMKFSGSGRSFRLGV